MKATKLQNAPATRPVATATVAVGNAATVAAFTSVAPNGSARPVAPKATPADRAAEKAARKEVARKARATLKDIMTDRPDARARELARIDGLVVPKGATVVDVAVIRRSQPRVADRLEIAKAIKAGAITRPTVTHPDTFGPVTGKAGGKGRNPSTRLFQPSAKGAMALARAFGASGERTITRREVISRACNETDTRSMSVVHRAQDALALVAGQGRTDTVRCEIATTLRRDLARQLRRAVEHHTAKADHAVGVLRASGESGQLTASALQARKDASERRAVEALARTFTKLYQRHGAGTRLAPSGDLAIWRAAVRAMKAPVAYKRALLEFYQLACWKKRAVHPRSYADASKRQPAPAARQPDIAPASAPLAAGERLALASAKMEAVTRRGVPVGWTPKPRD